MYIVSLFFHRENPTLEISDPVIKLNTQNKKG